MGCRGTNCTPASPAGWAGHGVPITGAALLVRYGWPVDEVLTSVNERWRATPKSHAKEHARNNAPGAEPSRTTRTATLYTLRRRVRNGPLANVVAWHDGEPTLELHVRPSDAFSEELSELDGLCRHKATTHDSGNIAVPLREDELSCAQATPRCTTCTDSSRATSAAYSNRARRASGVSPGYSVRTVSAVQPALELSDRDRARSSCESGTGLFATKSSCSCGNPHQHQLGSIDSPAPWRSLRMKAVTMTPVHACACYRANPSLAVACA